MQRRVHEEAILQQAASHGLQPCPCRADEQALQRAGFVGGALRLLSLGHAGLRTQEVSSTALLQAALST